MKHEHINDMAAGGHSDCPEGFSDWDDWDGWQGYEFWSAQLEAQMEPLEDFNDPYEAGELQSQPPAALLKGRPSDALPF